MSRAWIPTVVLALAAGGLAFWAGRATAPGPAPEAGHADAARAEALAAERAAVAGQGVALSAPQAREAFLLRELETERDKVESLTAQVETLRAKAGAEAARRTPEAEAAAHARYVYAGTEKALRVLDLDKAGESLRRMTPLIRDLLDSIRTGKPRMELQQEIGRYNTTLLGQALEMQGSGLPGEGVNGVFTHPAIQVNYIYATLKASEKPLTEKQEARLKELGDRYVQAEARRVAAYGEDTFKLQRLLEEAEQKMRFFADVDALLEPAQREVLHPESIRGRVRADLFSSGLVWAAIAGNLPFADRTSLARALTDNAMRHLQLPADQEGLVLQLAGDYAAGLDDAYLDHAPDALEQIGLLPEARVVVAARALLGFLRALADRLPVDQDVRKRIRDTGFVLVPLKR